MEVAKIRNVKNWRINKCGTTLAHPAAVNESKVQVLQKGAQCNRMLNQHEA